MSNAPKRIQLRRTKGWRKPEGCIVVTRSTRWGNPYRVGRGQYGWFVSWSLPGHSGAFAVTDKQTGLLLAVEAFREAIEDEELMVLNLDKLRGHDLACWCPLDAPCHADVLLELANK